MRATYLFRRFVMLGSISYFSIHSNFEVVPKLMINRVAFANP